MAGGSSPSTPATLACLFLLGINNTPNLELKNMLSSLTNKLQNISEQQKAQLNAMGIVLYEPITQIELAGQPWLHNLCELLKIPIENCLFDSNTPSFDEATQMLHLPATSYASEVEVKKLIWLNIRQYVRQ
jgi:hypothetical protein